MNFSRSWSLFLVAGLLACGPSVLRADSPALTQDQKTVMIMGFIQALHRNAASAEEAAHSLAKMGPAAEPATADLVDALHYDEDSVYLAISDALVGIGPSAVKYLRRDLNDDSFIIRKRAIEILGRFGPLAKSAAPGLVSSLGDPQYDVRSAADAALSKMGDDALPALADAVKSRNEGLRKLALAPLARCGPKAAPVLIGLLRKDDNAYLRSSAAEALGTLKPATPEVIQALIHALSDLEENVRGSAVDALAQQGDAAKAAVGPLMVVSQSDRDPLTRQKATAALEHIGSATKESVAGLVGASHDENAEVRRQAVGMLAVSTMSVSDAMSIYSNALGDPDPRVRLKAVQSAIAALHGNSAALLPILKQAIHDSHLNVRAAAIEGLGQLKDAAAEAAGELSRLHADTDPVVRQDAIHALIQLGPEGLPGLISALNDPYSHLSDEAGKGIVKLGDAATPALQSLEQGSDPELQQKAAVLLKQIQRKHRRTHA